MYPETWARFAAVLMFFGFNFTFFPQFIMGWAGMPRRYGSYPPEFQIYHVMSSAGAAVLAIAYLLPFAYMIWSLRWGRRAPDNPWEATGLEWQTSSPPPKHNFETLPTVDSGPYDYHREGYVDQEEEVAGGQENPQKGGEQE
jgi:cytochrome c oxidase subunit 1